jgi:hypothetical protein
LRCASRRALGITVSLRARVDAAAAHAREPRAGPRASD